MAIKLRRLNPMNIGVLGFSRKKLYRVHLLILNRPSFMACKQPLNIQYHFHIFPKEDKE